MTSTELTIVDEPRFVSRDTYSSYIDRYLTAARAIDGVIAIYQMGGVSTPGISDIDLIVVVDGSFQPHQYSQLSVRQIFEDDEQAAYLFTHDVMILDTTSFERLDYVFFASNLRHLAGEELSTQSPTAEEKRHLGFALLCDISLMRLHQFCRTELAHVLPVRNSLLRASSIKHTLHLAEPFEWTDLPQELTDEVNQFRRTWFEEGTIETARALVDRCASAFRTAVHACSSYFRNALLHINDRKFRDNVLLLSDFGRVTLFLDSSRLQRANQPTDRRRRNQAFRYLTDSNSTLVAYPEYLYFHYLTYAHTADNTVADLLKSTLSSAHAAFAVSPTYRATMQKRCQAIAAHAEFLQENRLYYSSGVGYPGINLRAYTLEPA
jgi:hypothetical protein